MILIGISILMVLQINSIFFHFISFHLFVCKIDININAANSIRLWPRLCYIILCVMGNRLSTVYQTQIEEECRRWHIDELTNMQLSFILSAACMLYRHELNTIAEDVETSSLKSGSQCVVVCVRWRQFLIVNEIWKFEVTLHFSCHRISRINL